MFTAFTQKGNDERNLITTIFITQHRELFEENLDMNMNSSLEVGVTTTK